MRSTRVYSISEYGMDGLLIEVECHTNNGLPGTVIVGMASKAVDEAKERLKAAFASSGLTYPRRRITLNLAPADEPKDSASLDLAMAISILVCTTDQPTTRPLDKLVFFGELALNGEIRAVRGIIGKLLAAERQGYKGAIVPRANLAQAKLVPGIQVKATDNLKIAAEWLFNDRTLPDSAANLPTTSNQQTTADISEVVGHHLAKRALEIAAAGGHNLLMNGPPGTGKTMLAKTLISILPPLNDSQKAEVTQIHSLADNVVDDIIHQPPFRSPHHTASTIAIIGGGQKARPGEISLAHNGVLLLDELPEYHRDCLEALRQPLEDHQVHVSRVKQTVTYPANFLLIATRNPCPCGYYGTAKACRCTAAAIDSYNKKLSGPIIDRIDLHCDVEEVNYDQLGKRASSGETSDAVKQRVINARQHQSKRNPGGVLNSQLTNRQLSALQILDPAAEQLLKKAGVSLGLSTRAYLKTMRVAITIADLSSSDTVTASQMAEALQFRPKAVDGAAHLC